MYFYIIFIGHLIYHGWDYHLSSVKCFKIRQLILCDLLSLKDLVIVSPHSLFPFCEIVNNLLCAVLLVCVTECNIGRGWNRWPC